MASCSVARRAAAAKPDRLRFFTAIRSSPIWIRHGGRTCAQQPVDGDDVPVPHFGVVLEMGQWEALAERLKAAGVRFVIEPHLRFQGHRRAGDAFLHDPSGNALEFQGVRRRRSPVCRLTVQRLRPRLEAADQPVDGVAEVGGEQCLQQP